MAPSTLRRTRPGRVGSLRSARKALWLAIHGARGVLIEAEEPALILAAANSLCASIREYAALARAIENQTDKT